jgi:hypothetical protein
MCAPPLTRVRFLHPERVLHFGEYGAMESSLLWTLSKQPGNEAFRLVTADLNPANKQDYNAALR